MAEFLIYAKDHWTSKLTLKQHKEMRSKNKNWDKKVQAASHLGDIVEAQEDEYWSVRRGWNKKVFALLKIPGLSLAEAKQFTGPHTVEVPSYNPDPERIPLQQNLKKFRCAIQVEVFPGKILEFPTLEHAMILDKAI